MKLQKELKKPTLKDVITYHNDLLVGVHLRKDCIKQAHLHGAVYFGQ